MAGAQNGEFGQYLTEEALGAAGVTDAQKTYEALEYILKKFRSLECSACHEHFGYSSRSNPNDKYCSVHCLRSGHSDQENEATVEKGMKDIKAKIARLPLTQTSENLVTITNGLKDVKIAEVVKSGAVKDELKGSNTSLASVRSGGPAWDVTDNASLTGTNASGAAMKKPVDRKPFAAASVLPARAEFVASQSRVVSPPQKSGVGNGGPKPVASGEPLMTLPAPVMTRPKAAPTATPAPAQSQRLMVNDVTISSNLYNNQQVVIQFAYAPNKFTISALADESRVQEVQTDIAKYVKTNPAVKTDLVKDEIVFAKYLLQDGSVEYYRALVISPSGNGKYKVNFVDYGDYRDVTAADCVEPSKEIMEKHHLYGVLLTLKGTHDQDLSMKHLESTGYGVTLDGEVFTLDMGAKDGMNWTGDLFFSGNKKPLTQHLKEVYEQVKPKVEPPATKAPEPKPAPVVAQPVAQKVPEPPVPAPSSTPANNTAAKTSMENRYSLIKTNPFLKPEVPKVKPAKQQPGYSPNINDGAKVQIAFVWSNSRVTVNAEADLAKIEELGRLVSKCVRPDNKLKEAPGVGDFVIAPYENSCYRARVDSIEKDMISVTFIDYGASTKVKYEDCYEVDEAVMNHPYYGRICRLKSIPEDIADVTSPELEEALNEIMTLEAHKTEQSVWEITLKLDQTRTYNKLIMKAITDQM